MESRSVDHEKRAAVHHAHDGRDAVDHRTGRWRVASFDHDAFHAAIRFRNRRP
nr:MAG TPA_asm: hypothetical protein [Caudoviricetes sp.]